MKKFISVAQASNRLKVSHGTVYNYLKTGILGGQYIKTAKKGTWRVSIESIELLETDASFQSFLQLKKENSQYSLF